jgi:hypothetical protein
MFRTVSMLGFGLLLVGSGPLWFIIIASVLGLWPDPSPNPVGPGRLFFITFWPAVFLIAVGAFDVRAPRLLTRNPSLDAAP